jgi:hypothetical protein
MGRDSGRSPSSIIRIEDEATAFDFDFACTTRLRFHDAEMQDILATKIINRLSEALTNGEDATALRQRITPPGSPLNKYSGLRGVTPATEFW